MPTDLPTARSHGGFSSVESPTPQMTLAFVSLTKELISMYGFMLDIIGERLAVTLPNSLNLGSYLLAIN